MGTDRRVIYPESLALPSPELTDDGKILEVNITTYGDVGDGADGDLHISSGFKIVNQYAGLKQDVSAGSDTLAIDDYSGISQFAIGDEIMIIQMQIYRNGYLGRYEFCKIQSIFGKDIKIETPLGNSYYSDLNGDKKSNTKTQIVKIPHYNSVVIESGGIIGASPWNGYWGGIVCFRCKTSITGGGYITARNTGYRAPWCSLSGEGYMGTAYDGVNSSYMGENHGGGSREASAGHANAGDDGRAYGTDDLLHELTLGAGGGGSYSSDAGGGIVALFCPDISISKIVVRSYDGDGFHNRSACGTALIVGSDMSSSPTDVQWERQNSRYGTGFYKNEQSPIPTKDVSYKDQNMPVSPIPEATLTDVGKTLVPEVVIHGDPTYADLLGDGSLGDVIISDTQIVNKYAGLNNNGGNDYVAGDNTVTVDSQAIIGDFSAGDQVMIIQMQVFRTTESELGKYEINKIESISGNNINLVTPLTNNYYSDDDGDKENNTKTQIIKIPQYNSLTVNGQITAQPWNGYCGGIVVVCSSHDITGGGSLNASRLGYRTGAGSRIGGEGYNGISTTSASTSGGGYGDHFSNGGGHKNVPQYGPYTLSVRYGVDDETRITIGGAGGHSYNSNGGVGGGAIVAFAGGTVNINGLNANGGSAHPGDGHIAGPGAGGKIVIFASKLESFMSVRPGRLYEEPETDASVGYDVFVPITTTQEIIYTYKNISTPSESSQLMEAQLFGGLI